MPQFVDHPTCGSPPHTWGRRQQAGGRGAGGGSPPHTWGRRGGTTPATPCPAVHPHTRGEDLASPWRHSGVTGSPPHTWGRPPPGDLVIRRGRFTPTHVGKTGTRGCSRPSTTVHPHTRGEDGADGRSGPGPRGSPPHTWGRRHRGARGTRRRRFTPTHVGKTFGAGRSSRVSTVRPHTRGEDADVRPWRRGPAGSPPHTWGRLTRVFEPPPHGRFTPTHVGKTPGTPGTGVGLSRFTPTHVGKTPP